MEAVRDEVSHELGVVAPRVISAGRVRLVVPVDVVDEFVVVPRRNERVLLQCLLEEAIRAVRSVEVAVVREPVDAVVTARQRFLPAGIVVGTETFERAVAGLVDGVADVDEEVDVLLRDVVKRGIVAVEVVLTGNDREPDGVGRRVGIGERVAVAGPRGGPVVDEPIGVLGIGIEPAIEVDLHGVVVGANPLLVGDDAVVDDVLEGVVGRDLDRQRRPRIERVRIEPRPEDDAGRRRSAAGDGLRERPGGGRVGVDRERVGVAGGDRVDREREIVGVESGEELGVVVGAAARLVAAVEIGISRHVCTVVDAELRHCGPSAPSLPR